MADVNQANSTVQKDLIANFGIIQKYRMAAVMQVSRTPRLIFQLGTMLPGVGEALKWEIAGRVLVDQPGLWGFEDGGCFGFGWE